MDPNEQTSIGGKKKQKNTLKKKNNIGASGKKKITKFIKM